MTKVYEREKAERLRRQGLSYQEIIQQVPVSIASLSLWLKDVKLTVTQSSRLAERMRRGQRAGAQRRREQRLAGVREIDEEVKQLAPKLLADSFFTLGLALYWAEGAKQKPWSVSRSTIFANSDPDLILLMRRWFQKYFDVSDDRFGYRLHIHESADIKKALKAWATLLDVPVTSIPVSLKRHKATNRRVAVDYKGLIQMRVYQGVLINRKIDRWTKVVRGHFLD